MSTVAHTPRVVADHYEIDGNTPIGSGGMALVFRGRDLRTRRDVALKTLKPEWVGDAAARARFRHEARTMAFLTHPNVARVYDLFEPDELSAPWAVLEFLPGPSLRQEIDREGHLDIDRIAHLLKQIASALDHLHKRGMVHLDVKPQNILFADPMTVKLIDFGIAQSAYTAPELLNGQSFGTVSYVSPEQATGDVVGPASDIYSLGCVAYEMVTGRTPFVTTSESTPEEILSSHVSTSPPALTAVRPDLNLPDWIDDVILDALRKDPDQRYTSTIGLADSFQQSLDAATPIDSTVPLGDLPRFDPRRNPVVVQDNRPRPAARRTGPPLITRIPTAFLWKLILIVAVGNVLLAGLSFFVYGTVPGLYDPQTTLNAATEVEVSAELLNVRDGPGDSADIVGQVTGGMVLDVTGPPESSWLPIEFQIGGETIAGYVATEHVEPVPLTGQQRLRRQLDVWLP